jgi:hypothetical protein
LPASTTRFSVISGQIWAVQGFIEYSEFSITTLAKPIECRKGNV